MTERWPAPGDTTRRLYWNFSAHSRYQRHADDIPQGYTEHKENNNNEKCGLFRELPENTAICAPDTVVWRAGLQGQLAALTRLGDLNGDSCEEVAGIVLQPHMINRPASMGLGGARTAPTPRLMSSPQAKH